MRFLEFQLLSKEENIAKGCFKWREQYLLFAWQKNKIGNYVQSQVRIVSKELLNLMYSFIQLSIHST